MLLERDIALRFARLKSAPPEDRPRPNAMVWVRARDLAYRLLYSRFSIKWIRALPIGGIGICINLDLNLELANETDGAVVWLHNGGCDLKVPVAEVVMLLLRGPPYDRGAYGW